MTRQRLIRALMARWARVLALLAPGAIGAASAGEPGASPDAAVRDFAIDLGYAVDDRDSASFADALERFEALIGIEAEARPGTHPATLAMLAIAASKGRPPCPGWSVGAADEASGERTEIAVRFRGDTHLEQAAFAHARIEECFRPLLYAESLRPETGLIEVLANGDAKIVDDFGSLPAAYAPLRPYFEAVDAAKKGVAPGPTYRVFVDPELQLDLVLSEPALAPADDSKIVKAKAPTARGRREICIDLGLSPTCLPASAVRKDAMYIDRGRIADGYVGRIAMPQTLVILSVPAAHAREFGYDLAETATLQFGLDALRAEARPQYLLRRFVSNESYQIPCGESILSVAADPPVADPAKMAEIELELRKRLQQYWRTLLHWRDSPTEIFAKEMHRPIRTLVVDDFEPSTVNGVDQKNANDLWAYGGGRRTPVDDIPRPGLWISADSQQTISFFASSRFFINEAPSADKKAHAAFAANVIASKSILRFGSGTSASEFNLGVAPKQVSVSLAPARSLEESFKNAKSRVLLDHSIIAVPFTDPQPCLPRASSEASALANRSDFLEYLDKTPEKPVFVLSAPQTDYQSNCDHVDNSGLRYVESKIKDGDYVGVDPQEYAQLRTKTPFWGVKNGTPLNSFGDQAIKCTGYHCMESDESVIVVAALKSDGKLRKDSRLTYDIDQGWSGGKVFLAPGTDLLNGDSRGAVDGLGMRCGTSFAGPVVAGIAADMLARWPRLSPSEVKRRLAATVGLGSVDVFRLVQANMSYGIVNLERAVQSNPDKFTLWLTRKKDPLSHDFVYVRSGAGQQLLTDAVKSKDDWKDLIALIRPPNGVSESEAKFLGVNWRDGMGAFVRWNKPAQTKPGDGDDWHSFDELMGDGFGLFPCSTDQTGCLRVSDDGGQVEDIAISEISHIVFPRR